MREPGDRMPAPSGEAAGRARPGDPLRVGVLGAADIAPNAIVTPAHLTGARLVAVAARDRSRAEAFASGL